MSKRNGSWLPLRSASWSARGLCFILCIALLLLPSLSYANSTREIVRSTEEHYMTILAYSKQLTEELRLQKITLEEYKQKSSDLQNELAIMSSDLENLQTDSASLKQEISELKSSIDELLKKQQEDLKRYEALEKTCQKIAETAQKEIRRQKIETVIMAVVAFLVGASLGYGLKAVVDGW